MFESWVNKIAWIFSGGQELKFARGIETKRSYRFATLRIPRRPPPPGKLNFQNPARGLFLFPLSFPFSRPHFSSTENADFEMKVARLKRHFFSFFFFFFFAKVNPLETLFLPFSPFAHKYLNKITIRGKEVGLIFKKAHPCIKDYETTMVESGGNFPPDYSREIVYREILKKKLKKEEEEASFFHPWPLVRFFLSFC